MECGLILACTGGKKGKEEKKSKEGEFSEDFMHGGRPFLEYGKTMSLLAIIVSYFGGGNQAGEEIFYKCNNMVSAERALRGHS